MLYECKDCRYVTERKSNYDKHLNSKKHLSKCLPVNIISDKYNREELLEQIKKECDGRMEAMTDIVIESDVTAFDKLLMAYHEMCNRTDYDEDKYKYIIRHNIKQLLFVTNHSNRIANELIEFKEIANKFYDRVNELEYVNSILIEHRSRYLEYKTENDSLKKELEELKACHNQMPQNPLCKCCSLNLSSSDSNKSP
jgi:hypothetical protein